MRPNPWLAFFSLDLKTPTTVDDDSWDAQASNCLILTFHLIMHIYSLKTLKKGICLKTNAR